MRFIVPLLSFLLEAALIVLGVIMLFSDPSDALLTQQLLWNLLAVLYLVGGFWVLRRTRDEVGQSDRTNWWAWLRLDGIFSRWFAPLISLVGLSAGINAIFFTPKGGDVDALINMVSIAGVVLSWFLLHVGYARLYSWLLRNRMPGALQLPEGKPPTMGDLLYFSITIGTSFAVSDVETRSTAMRWRVLSHSVVAFFYNAVVLAIGLKFLTGNS